MRSLWRDLALQWLGGDGSAALAVDISFLDRFPMAAETPAPVFRVARADGVSPAAMLRAAAEIAPPLPAQ